MNNCNKKIWIVNYYTQPPTSVSNPRYIEFASFFLRQGCKVTTFNAVQTGKAKSFFRLSERSRYGSYDFVHVLVPTYRGNGLKRILSIFIFAIKILIGCRKFEKPDIILHNVHTPFDYPIHWVARMLGAKYIAEAWDPWPEAFVTVGLLSEKSILMKIAYKIEYHLYQKADAIIFTYEGGLQYLRDKHWTNSSGGKIEEGKVHYVNNGVNLEKFDYDSHKHVRDDDDLKDNQYYKIIYLGSIRLVNGVSDLIKAAEILQESDKYRFFIYGDGNERAALEQYVSERNIRNVIFKERRIPLEDVPYVVSKATVNIMNYQKKFGIHGVSSGKMFQYLAAGKPILCNVSLNYSLISGYNCGIDKDIDTPSEYAECIKRIAESSVSEYQEMCVNARRCAELFDYQLLASKEFNIINNL